jgi:hypothetical protein
MVASLGVRAACTFDQQRISYTRRRHSSATPHHVMSPACRQAAVHAGGGAARPWRAGAQRTTRRVRADPLAAPARRMRAYPCAGVPDRASATARAASQPHGGNCIGGMHLLYFGCERSRTVRRT